MQNKHEPYGLYEKYFKRPLDFLCALTAAVILSPVMLVTAALVRIKLGSPVLFCQERPGLDEKIFKLYKFRTMSDARDENGDLLPDAERLGHFGKVLRSTSLDELPSLVNIIKGELSLVGPRPLAVQYLPFYNEEEKKRHEVLPGLTGLAQVHGRNAATWEERFANDIQYVDSITFLGDAKIILLTAKTALSRTGIGVRGVDSPIDFDEYRRKQLSGEEAADELTRGKNHTQGSGDAGL